MPNEMALAAVSEEERAATERVRSRLKSPRRVKFKDGRPTPRRGQPEAMPYNMLAEIAKTGDVGTAMQLAYSAAGFAIETTDRDKTLETALSQLVDLEPQNPLEAMLIAQMVAVNTAIARCVQEAWQYGPLTDHTHKHLASATRLQRTFLLQIEALQRLRGKGQQEIRVEHVNVGAGGQAIVGNVTMKKGGG